MTVQNSDHKEVYNPDLDLDNFETLARPEFWMVAEPSAPEEGSWQYILLRRCSDGGVDEGDE